MLMLGVLIGISLLCLAAPLYADHVAHTDPFSSNINGTTIVDGRTVDVIQESTTGLGIGPTAYPCALRTTERLIARR